MISRTLIVSALVAVLAINTVSGFVPHASSSLATKTVHTPLHIFGGKKKTEDLSDIEVRDMTREEMLAMNEQNEEIMNMELTMMTAFSAVISLPILYLCWVAFFSD